MSDPFVLLGIGTGLVLSLFYVLFVVRRTAKKPNLTDAIVLLMSTVGLLTGVKVCWFAYLYRNVAPIKEISLQTFVGGFAVGWVAIASAVKKFRGD